MNPQLQYTTPDSSMRKARFPIRLNVRVPRLLAIAITVVVFFFSPALTKPTIAGQESSTKALFTLDSTDRLNSLAKSPFPSDWFTVRDNANKTHLRVDLPEPNCDTQVSDCEDLKVLNKLDGFNVLPRLSVPFSGPIDPSTVTSDTVFLVSLGVVGPGQDYMPWGTVIGINQVVWDTFTNTLDVESNELLAQDTRFALVVTRGVLDVGNAPVGASDAFRRFRATVRDDYKEELLEAIQAARRVGVREEDIAVASVFTTQSATAILEKIRDQIDAATPAPADFFLVPNGGRTVFNLDKVTSIAWNQQTKVNPTGFTFKSIDLSQLQNPYPNVVGSIAYGKYSSPDYEVHPLQYIPPVGTRSGTPTVQETNEIYFNLFLPSGTKPTNGWPVAIFVHGNTGSKEVAPLSVVSSMAKYGIATIAINNVGHGYGEESKLIVSRTNGTSVIFPAGGRGIDQDGNGTIDPNEGILAASPWTIVSFSDGYRQTAADLMQLVRVIEVGMDVDGDGQSDLDPSRIYLFTQSLGGGIGTVFASVEPNVRLDVLTVPFDPVPGAILSCKNRFLVGGLLFFRTPSLVNAPGIKALDGCQVNPPRFNENFPLRDEIPLTVQLGNFPPTFIKSPVINTVTGAMALQEVEENYKWVGQAGSPLAYAPHLHKAPLAGVPPKSVLLLTATGDQTSPNPTTTAIVRAGDLADRTLYYRHDLYCLSDSNLPKNPHGFAIDFADFGAITKDVQDMVGEFFFSDGDALTLPVTSQYLEFPIASPLPESLNYSSISCTIP